MAHEKYWPPTREGVHVDPFGEVTVPERKRSWSQHRYYSTYDRDVMTVWILHADGGRVRYYVGGPVSARAVINNLRPGAVHLVEWGRTERPEPQRFPLELIERARLAQPDGGR